MACSLVRGLVEQLRTGPANGLADHDVRERDARRTLDLFPLPAAVYGSSGTRLELTNQAWRDELANVPAAMAALIARAVETDQMVQVSKLVVERGSTPVEYEANVHPLRGRGVVTGAFVVCVAADRRWFASAANLDDAQLGSSERSALLAAAHTARVDTELANHLKDQFLAMLSHELRTPIATMLLWERILRGDPPEPVRKQALDAIRQSALAQSRVVSDLLDVSRAISGKLFVDTQPVALDTVVAEAIEAATVAAQAKGVALVHVGVVPILVEGDAVRLRQVVDNVILNAVAFTESGGRIEVRQRRKGHTALIEVTDTGRGIAAEGLDRIFDPFHQTDGHEGGLGLGLAIARQLAELHGGTLSAASEGLGRGATLTLTLPLSRKPPAESSSRDLA